jgi:hypothetical protein
LSYDDLTADQQTTLTLLATLSTGKIQVAAGQRLIDATSTFVVDVDVFDFSPWLIIPQRPVRSVAAVTIDGTVYTDWVLRGQRLWRLGGWNLRSTAPSEVIISGVEHGYVDGSQGLQLARDMCFSLAAAGWSNPGGTVASESIDDYRVTFTQAEERMQVTPSMRDMLREAYGLGSYVTGGC